MIDLHAVCILDDVIILLDLQGYGKLILVGEHFVVYNVRTLSIFHTEAS